MTHRAADISGQFIEFVFTKVPNFTIRHFCCLQDVKSLLEFAVPHIMKPAKQFIREIKELAKKGDPTSLKAALNKATDAHAVHPNNQAILALIELLS